MASRRRFLRRSAAALALSGGAVTAGCGSVSLAGDAGGWAKQWLPATLPGFSEYVVWRVDAADIRGHEDAMTERAYATYAESRAWERGVLDIGFEDVSVQFQGGILRVDAFPSQPFNPLGLMGFTLARAEFNRPEAAATLASEGFRTISDNEISVYESETGPQSYALTDEWVLFGAPAPVREVVAARRGKRPRYGDRENFALVRDELGTRSVDYIDMRNTERLNLEGVVGKGGAHRITADGTDGRAVRVFRDAESLARNDLDAYADSQFAAFDGVSVRTAGRVATISFTRPGFRPSSVDGAWAAINAPERTRTDRV